MALAAPGDVHIVHRDDLLVGEALSRALADGYGAESGDEVIEVRLGGVGAPSGAHGPMTPRRWRLGEQTVTR